MKDLSRVKYHSFFAATILKIRHDDLQTGIEKPI